MHNFNQSGAEHPVHWARHKNVAAGVIMGAIAAATTLSLGRIAVHPSNLLERWLESIAFTLVLPGLLVDFLSGRSGLNVPPWLPAACNFVFWLGFAWLFGFLVDKLRAQIRLLASHF
ncbi:MAG: hypothetical protein WCF17_01115 [Terracidiphilus sp.]